MDPSCQAKLDYEPDTEELAFWDVPLKYDDLPEFVKDQLRATPIHELPQPLRDWYLRAILDAG